MSRRHETIKAALESGNFKVYDESMDDPSSPYPWTISIPGSYTIGQFSEEFVAKVVFDALQHKVAATPEPK